LPLPPAFRTIREQANMQLKQPMHWSRFTTLKYCTAMDVTSPFASLSAIIPCSFALVNWYNNSRSAREPVYPEEKE